MLFCYWWTKKLGSERSAVVVKLPRKRLDPAARDVAVPRRPFMYSMFHFELQHGRLLQNQATLVVYRTSREHRG